MSDGVLTLHEYEERTGLLWQTRTRRELDALVADLPAEGVPASVPGVAEDVRPQRVLAVMSEDRFAGAIVPGQDVQGYAVMGKVVVDLRRDDLPSGTRVQVRSLMGEVEVQVPPGSLVRLSGLAVMGDRTVQVDQGDGPVVHVDAVAVMGSVRVTQGDGTVVRSERGAARPLPVQRASSVPVARGHGGRHGSGLGALLGKAGGLLLPVAVLGGVLLAGPDSASVFGSNVVHASPNGRVEVSALFGEVQVVVPDDTDVRLSGFLPFGDTDCRACGGSGAGSVQVRRLGAFAQVDVVTRSQWQAEQRADEAEERREEAEEEREEAEG